MCGLSVILWHTERERGREGLGEEVRQSQEERSRAKGNWMISHWTYHVIQLYNIQRSTCIKYRSCKCWFFVCVSYSISSFFGVEAIKYTNIGCSQLSTPWHRRIYKQFFFGFSSSFNYFCVFNIYVVWGSESLTVGSVSTQYTFKDDALGANGSWRCRPRAIICPDDAVPEYKFAQRTPFHWALTCSMDTVVIPEGSGVPGGTQCIDPPHNYAFRPPARCVCGVSICLNVLANGVWLYVINIIMIMTVFHLSNFIVLWLLVLCHLIISNIRT